MRELEELVSKVYDDYKQSYIYMAVEYLRGYNIGGCVEDKIISLLEYEMSDGKGKKSYLSSSFLKHIREKDITITLNQKNYINEGTNIALKRLFFSRGIKYSTGEDGQGQYFSLYGKIGDFYKLVAFLEKIKQNMEDLQEKNMSR